MTMKISVLGLGYIGLPTAAMLATHGHHVYGYDTNARILDRLANGDIHIEEPGLLAFVRDALATGRLTPTPAIEAADAYLICVPTPFDTVTKKADLSYVENAAKSLVPLVKRGDLVILESTVPAGTTEDVLAPILATTGLDPRTDLHVVHCPETVLPGNTILELQRNNRIVGGLTPAATAAAVAMYESFVQGAIVTTNARTAEFVKLVENAYRDVNIAFANETAKVARGMGIDSREAIRIANMHPRVNVHQPGPGVGGHCIPVDPWFLIQAHPDTPIMRAARAVNDAMPGYVVDVTRQMLEGVEGSQVALLGLSYKGNVDDVRESPSLTIAKLLPEHIPGCSVRIHDPHVPEDRHAGVGLEDAVDGADVLIIATDHDEFRRLDPAGLAARMRRPRVVDARGILDRDAWTTAGFLVERL